MATKKRSTRRKSSKRSSSRARRNPAGITTKSAMNTAKEAGAIIVGNAAAAQVVGLVNGTVLASQGRAVKAAAGVGVPTLAGLALMGKSRNKAVQNVGLGMVVFGVQEGVKATISAVTSGGGVSGPRALGCGSCSGHRATPAVRTLPARTASAAMLAPSAGASAPAVTIGNTGARLPAAAVLL